MRGIRLLQVLGSLPCGMALALYAVPGPGEDGADWCPPTRVATENANLDETRAKAEAGDVWAQGELGWMYYPGRGAAQDKEKALQIWRKALEPTEIGRAQATSAGGWELVQDLGRRSASASLGL